MITINLLPEYLRVDEKKSATQLLTLLGGIAIALTGFIIYAVIHFQTLPAEQKKLAEKRHLRKKLRKFERQHKRLRTVLKTFQGRKKSVERCRAERVAFSKKIYELCELMDQQRPVWLTGLNIRKSGMGKARGMKLPRFLWTSNGTCADKDIKVATGFYRALLESKFFSNFVETKTPKYSKTSLPAGYRQKTGVRFSLYMLMQVQPPKKPKPAEKPGNKKQQKKRG